MKRIKNLLFITIFITTFYSCGSIEGSEKTVAQFYDALKAEDYDKALDLCSKKALEIDDKTAWKNAFRSATFAHGVVESYERYSFNTSYKNGTTYVDLFFKVKRKQREIYERVTTIKEGDTYKIMGYQFSKNKSDLKSEEEKGFVDGLQEGYQDGNNKSSE